MFRVYVIPNLRVSIPNIRCVTFESYLVMCDTVLVVKNSSNFKISGYCQGNNSCSVFLYRATCSQANIDDEFTTS